MKLENITDENFDQITSEGVVLVDFWAPWCAPCRMVAPILEELQEEMGDSARIVKLNVDENPESAMKHQTTSIPTVIVFKDGSMVDRIVGAANKERYKSMLTAQVS